MERELLPAIQGLQQYQILQCDLLPILHPFPFRLALVFTFHPSHTIRHHYQDAICYASDNFIILMKFNINVHEDIHKHVSSTLMLDVRLCFQAITSSL